VDIVTIFRVKKEEVELHRGKETGSRSHKSIAK
jgi:hypothetical protein